MRLPIAGIVGVATGPEDLRPDLAADAIEIRADLWPGIEAALAALGSVGRPAIFTCRHAAEGGAWQGDEDARVRIYRRAHRLGAALLDVEGRAPAGAILVEEGLPILLSWHDFESTPSNIIGIFEDLEAHGAAGVKIVPTARTVGDSLRLLGALSRGASGCRVGFCMGAAGVFSRILARAWGSALTYGALGRAVASGQLSAEDLGVLCPNSPGEPRILVLGAPEKTLRTVLGARIAARLLGRPAAILPTPVESAEELEALRRGLDPLGAIAEDPRAVAGIGPIHGGSLGSEPTAIRWDARAGIEGRAPRGEATVARRIAADLAWILRVEPAPAAEEAIARALA